MKQKEEIRDKVILIEKKLTVINDAILKEIDKPFFSRSKSICRFLYIEKKIYTRLYKELKWVLNE